MTLDEVYQRFSEAVGIPPLTDEQKRSALLNAVMDGVTIDGITLLIGKDAVMEYVNTALSKNRGSHDQP